MKNLLLKKIADRTAIIGVIGLGYVGLPLAVEKAKAGFRTIGFDVQVQKVNMLNRGQNYIGDVIKEDINSLVSTGRLQATNDYSFLKSVDFVAICVPTPLDGHMQPDISYIKNSALELAKYLHRGMIVVLESTTFPGTTRELLMPILESSGLKCGIDFYLGFSPERVDPGNILYKTKNTPKVVSGIGDDATEVIASMYETVLQSSVFKASCTEIAEMSKLLENTYRNVNIALVNELAVLCHQLKIDIWEVIEAAKTKPFGFSAFYPGPGIGGHCIPLDPYYLTWKAKEYGFHFSMIETSMMINDAMPKYCVARASSILNRRLGIALSKANILLLGVAYKQDIDDCRESPALKVFKGLIEEGATVKFFDPYVQQFILDNKLYYSEKSLCKQIIQAAHLVIITTAHTCIDYKFVQKYATAIFDTKNVTKDLLNNTGIEVL